MEGESFSELVELWEAPSVPQSLQWAPDGSLAVARSNTVTVLSPRVQLDVADGDKTKEKALVYNQYHITSPDPDFQGEPPLDLVTGDVRECGGSRRQDSGGGGAGGTNPLAYALRYERLKRQRLMGQGAGRAGSAEPAKVRAVAWAPLGTVFGSRCLLGVCFDDGRVVVFRPPLGPSASLFWSPVQSVTVQLKDMVHNLKATCAGTRKKWQTAVGRLDALDCVRLAWTKDLLQTSQLAPFALLAVAGRRMVSLWRFEPPSLSCNESASSCFQLQSTGPQCWDLLSEEAGRGASVTALEFSPQTITVEGKDRLMIAIGTLVGLVELWMLERENGQGGEVMRFRKWRTVHHTMESSIDALCFCTSWTGQMKLVFTQGMGGLWVQDLPDQAGQAIAERAEQEGSGEVLNAEGAGSFPEARKVVENSGHSRPIAALCAGPRAPPSESGAAVPVLVISGSLDGALSMWDLSTDANQGAVGKVELIEVEGGGTNTNWKPGLPIWGLATSPQSRTVAVLHLVGAELQNTRSNQSFVLKKHNHAKVSVLNLIGPEDLVATCLEKYAPPWDWLGAVNTVIGDFFSTGESFSKLSVGVPDEDSLYSPEGILRAIAHRFVSVINTIPGAYCQVGKAPNNSEMPVVLQLEIDENICDQALRLLHLTAYLLPEKLVDPDSVQMLKDVIYSRFLFPELRINKTPDRSATKREIDKRSERSKLKRQTDDNEVQTGESSNRKNGRKHLRGFTQRIQNWLHSNRSFIAEQFRSRDHLNLPSLDLHSFSNGVKDFSFSKTSFKQKTQKETKPCPVCAQPILENSFNGSKKSLKESFFSHIDKCSLGHSIQCCGKCLEYTDNLILSSGCCHICREIYHVQDDKSGASKGTINSFHGECLQLVEYQFECIYCSIPLDII